jgi:hypothetical protein
MHTTFLDNESTQEYFDLINTAKTQKIDSNTRYENHHIVPKSLGGSNNSINLVTLSNKEHFRAHRLLTEMTTGKNKAKMVYAFWTMANVKNQHQSTRYIPTIEEYEEALLKRRSLKTGAETRAKMSSNQKGKVAIYNEIIDKMKYIRLDEIDQYIDLGYARGERPKSRQHKQAISKGVAGQPSNKKGKTYEEIYGIEKAAEFRLKISTQMPEKPAWNKGSKNTGFGDPRRINPMKDPEKIKKMLDTRRKNKGEPI